MQLLLASPRGFCAGVERAVRTVERAIEQYGAPIYVRHEIVHNRHVVDELKEKGVIFVDELDEVPDNAVVIFSAHGVSRMVKTEGSSRELRVIDATCPLVTKVHREARRNAEEGLEQILIGHAGHPEVIGTMGQIKGHMHLVSTVADVEALEVKNPHKLAFVTQTTLSIDDMADIVAA
ncbi:MAG: 4-hydroxy-3-methylbut-2-enyl diphosphate reductase, partial [Thermodesulfobacteriota bacterium]